MDKREKVLRLCELTNLEENTTRNIQMVWQTQWAAMPEVAAEVLEETGFDIANRVFDVISVSELMELMLPILEEGLTEEELDSLIAIYETPIGRVLIEKYPSILKQTFQVSAEYGQRKMREKLQELDLTDEEDEENEEVQTPHTYGSLHGGRENPSAPE